MIIEAKYFDNYKLMIELMNNPKRRVIAFLGAGLTRRFGYGSWEELIFGNKEISDPAKPNCLMDYADLKLKDFEDFKDEYEDYDLLSSAQKCFETIGKDKWNEFLEKTFGDIDSIKVNVDDDPIANIFLSEFFCFITTNFDAVLKRYGEKCINGLTIQVYPKNLHKPLPSNLIYLHGAGFKVFEDYIPQIVLNKSSYTQAYNKVSQISGFLKEIVFHDIVFIGFSMNDKYISEFMNQLEEYRINTIKSNPKENPQIFQRNKFIILPYHSQTLKYKESQKTKEVSLIDTEDERLESQNLQIIRYKKESNNPYKIFPELMGDISKKAPNIKLLSKPYDITESWR